MNPGSEWSTMEFQFTDQLYSIYRPVKFTISTIEYYESIHYYTLCMNRCIEMPQNAIHKIAIEKVINVKRLDPLNIKEF